MLLKSEVCSKADIGKAFVINLGFVGTRPTAILRPERCVLAVTDHDMVVEFHLKRIGGGFQFARSLDVVSGRLGISGRRLCTTMRAEALKIKARFMTSRG